MFCEEQKGRRPITSQECSLGGGGRGGHDCRTVTPGLNGLLAPPKTVQSFTVVASENFTDFSVTPA